MGHSQLLGKIGGRATLLCGLLTGVCGVGSAQNVMTGSGGTVRLFGTDQAILEVPEPRKDLPCAVIPTKSAQVGFDLKFHGGYEVSVPMKELSGQENLLTIIFRVTPLKGDATYFIQRIRVPEIEEDAKGEASFYGSFDIGEGKYKVDWLMRDRAERVCSNYWDVDAQLSDKDNQMALSITSGAVRQTETEFFRQEPPVERDSDPTTVKILLNYAPQNPRSSVMRPVDTSALVSILRNISRDPRVSRFSLVAFCMQEQKILYRQENAEKIDFPALGDALAKIQLGRVDLARLADKKSDIRFLTDLMRSELGNTERPDAFIFAGPKVMLDRNIETDALKEIGNLDAPVFYMNYNLFPHAIPWRDTIGNAVKYFKGLEYTISRPRDLWSATAEVVNRIQKSRSARIAQNAKSN
ncbi:MAG: acetyltransferase [Acidobacteria bacterium]|nr:acetyltransferase [Acidobacteriota bacterium]